MPSDQPRAERGFPLFVSSLALVIAMAALLAVAFKLNGANAQGPLSSTRPTASSSPSEQVKLVIKSDEEHARKGSDGSWHDAYLPADFSVKPGRTVEVIVLNYDEAEHTFTSPQLGTDATIAAGSEGTPSETTFTFKAPARKGRFLWFCTMPCDPWAMNQLGFMRGHVTVA
ncbi:MAG TPA: cupredoxin domain-containing protein [Solirubrobacterales bacterium]